MRSIKMSRDELLKIVKGNQVTHIYDYLEAVEDYKKLVLKITQENVKLAETGDLEKIKDIKSVPQAPHSYETDYARAIRMLELSIDDIIELDETIFNQLVLDEWAWKVSFAVSNSVYKTML